MYGGGGKFHAQFIGQAVQGQEVAGIAVLRGHAEADVLQSLFSEFFQGGQSPVEAVLQTPDLIVGLLKTLNGNADADVRKLPAEVNDPICEKSVGGDYDAVAFFSNFSYNFFQILPQERLAAGDVGKIHPGQLADGIHRDFILRLRRCPVAAAHIAAGVTPVGNDDGSVKFLLHVVCILSLKAAR